MFKPPPVQRWPRRARWAERPGFGSARKGHHPYILNKYNKKVVNRTAPWPLTYFVSMSVHSVRQSERTLVRYPTPSGREPVARSGHENRERPAAEDDRWSAKALSFLRFVASKNPALAQPVMPALLEEAASQSRAALQPYGILDSPPEAAFDALTQRAAFIRNAPMAAVTLADARRLWIKSIRGLDLRESALV